MDNIPLLANNNLENWQIITTDITECSLIIVIIIIIIIIIISDKK